MLPQLAPDQQVFIEITNPTHGGGEWELGQRLWSPVFSTRDGAQSNVRKWKIMERVEVGDLVIHMVDMNNVYRFAGISIVAQRVQQTPVGPPIPDKWGHMSPYQYVELTSYVQFESPEPITSFFTRYRQELKEIAETTKEGQFFEFHGARRHLRVAQRYMAPCTEEVYALLSRFSTDLDIDLSYDATVPTQNEPAAEDQAAGRTFAKVSRVIRDTALSRRLKTEYHSKCQVCGTQIPLANGGIYSEGHHIKPLGSKHNGPDVRGNIIILCPNHHAEFDYVSIAIHPGTLRIHHIDPSNTYHDKPLAYPRGDIRLDLLEYHYAMFLKNVVAVQERTAAAEPADR